MNVLEASELAAELARIPAAHRWELLHTVDSRGMGYTCRIYSLDDSRLVLGLARDKAAASAVKAAKREAGLG